MTHGFAIVGIGCRFPGGADSPERFWALLRDGVSAIRQAPSERFDAARVFNPDPAHVGTTYSLQGGYLDSVDMFDAPFFGFSPREASRMDPQQRLLLEVAHEAFEDAGLSIDRLAGSRAGVFVGLSTHDYGDMQLSPANRRLIDAHTNSGSAESIAANRISYVFDLRGPSMVVDTACSSSLTAAHLALRALRSGDCDTALVGGSMLILTPEPSIGFSKASMISPDGRSRAFAAGANGYVRSEGVAAVLLRPLEAALAEGDRIYAVLRGSAINQDGRTNGMTVPSPEQQELMLRAGLADAGLEPADIQYVEAHGTGTPVGDPIEAAAIGAVFGPTRAGDDRCAIGSVKTNIGHIEAAAGMAGLIKAALALHHRALPPSLNFDEPHPEIDFEALRLRVVTGLEPWPANGAPARTVVNSFGFGGANANVVLEEAPAAVAEPPAESLEAPQLLALSARSSEALADLARDYSELLRADGERFAADCRAAARRRGHHDHRLAVVTSSASEAAEALDAFAAGGPRGGTASGRRSTQHLAFVFSGMGPQWWAMGRELFERDPVFRTALERCEDALTAAGCWSVIDSLLADEPSSRMADPDVAQAANFALQVGLTDLLRHNGIEPDYVVGHSAGEMAAAYAAGALSLEDAALVTYHRSRLQALAAGEGTMLAAAIDEEEAARLLAQYGDRATLAAVNAPQSVTLSGDAEVLERLLTELTERDVFARILAVDVPYHSRSMDPILDELAASLATLAPETPKVPLASPLTGKLVQGPDLGARYWCGAVRHAMRFGDAVDTLLDEGCGIFLEIGPHPVLGASLRECLSARQVPGTVVPTLRREEDEAEAMLRALGSLYAVGRSPDWEVLYPGRAEHVALPTYPWQRERHWLESLGDEEALPAADPNEHPLLGRRVRAASPLWEASLGDPRLGYLDDHIVQGTSPFPGAGYVEMGLSVSRRLLGHAAPGVRNVEFRRALFLGNRDEALVQLGADPDSQRFEIHSLSARGEQSWTARADGSIAGGRAAERRVDLAAARARCGPELPREDVYASLAERGLGYGPSFQGLDRVAAGGGEAVAEISLELDIERYEVHPALLDSAFQLLVVAGQSLGDALPPGGFLPVRVGEVRVHRPPGSRFFAHARATSVDERFAGDIDVVDEDGAVLVEVRGLECQFLDETTAAETVDDWLYEYRWEPLPLGAGRTSVLASAGLDLDSLAAAAKGQAQELDWSAYYDDVEPVLDAAAAAYALAAFRELGWNDDRHELTDPQSFSALLGLDESREPLVAALLALTGDRSPQEDPAELLRELVATHPAYELDAALLARCGEQMAAVLRGAADAREFLFSGEAIDLMTRFYRESPTARFYNRLLADAVEALLGPDEAGRAARVLEVGGGTGGTTAHLLGRLNGRAEYVFTDVSSVFTGRAEDEFGGNGSFTSSVLDLERDPADQGLAPGSFDIVVAANVLHATTDLEHALRRVRSLVAPGGALVMLEITRRARWLDAVFGLMDGWWAFTDHELRDGHPLLGTKDWLALLERTDFTDLSVLHDVPSNGPSGQSVLVARAPERNGARAEAHWALIGEGDGLGRRLAERLELAGASCSRVPSSEGGSAAGADGIVDLSALDVIAQGRGGDDAPVEWQVAACAGVADLLRTLDSAGGPPSRLVLVTTGAQAVPGFELELRPDQAVLWGLGRTLDRERSDIRCRLVDLSPEPTDDEVDLLVAELVAGGLEEEEIVLRGNVRLVPRLSRLEATGDDPPARRAEPADRFRAEVQTRGLLESVRLVQIAESPLGPGEVDVAVAAAGLNFRDVMLALDLLPPLALRELRDTDRMGLECAGTVSAVGEGVEGIAPGDEVVAIGYGTFGSHVRAAGEIVVPKPADLGFDEAAGVAVAFATAYVGLVRLARLTRGEKVLIHAATGGVGLAAIEVARDVGAEIYATAGSPEKREHLRALGIEHVFDSRTLDFADEIMEQTDGAGVDVVLNSLAGEAIARGISILAPSGRFVEIGKRDIYEDRRIGLLDFRKNLSYFALDLDRLLAEQPKLVGEICREVLGKIESGAYRLPPVEVFPIGDVTGALRKVAQAKHIGKVVIQVAGEEADIVPRRDGRSRFREDGTYLVTGGLGGFGLALAGWLSQQGAGTIVLTGRRGAQRDTEAAIDAIRAAGARVEVIAADVVDPQAVDMLLSQIREELPPLRGVFHTAMVIDDAPLSELGADRFRSVLEAKVGGALNLHEQTSADPLDAFVLFSSLAGLFGNAAQANYAAANSFLDALAHHRRALGMPALAVDWGAISDVGYVSRHKGLAPFLESQGYLGFDAEQAFSALGRLLEQDLAHGMAARIDFTRLPAPLPASPRIRHLVPEAASSPGESAPDVSSEVAQVLAAPPEQASALAVDALRASIARVLGTDPAAIATERPLTELGLDSLMAVELTASLKADFGIELPVVRLLEGIDVATLADLVVAELERRRSAAPDLPPIPAEPKPATKGDVVLDGDAAEVYTSLDYTAWTRRQRLARSSTTGFFRATARVEAEGLEHVPRSGAAVLATNHLSMADIPLMFTLLERPVVPLVAEELRRYPWLRLALSDVANAIHVRRGEGDEEAMANALAVLRSGGMVAVGPEGRRSLTGALEAGKTGVAYLATQAGVPVVPAVAWGQEQLGRNLRRLRRAPVQVRFGPPLHFPAGERKAAELREHTDAIMRALARMLPEEYRGVYAGQTEGVGAGLSS